MLFSPYRSIVVGGEEKEEINDLYVEIIENSIMNYKKTYGYEKSR